jgi:SnoaL-like domain
LSATERALREWQAEREITRVLLDYARGVDQRNYRLVRGCFHASARIDYGSFGGGPDALVDWLEELQPRVDRSSNLFGPPRIDLDLDRDCAEVESYCLSVQVLPRDADGVAHQTLAGLRYLDRFELRNGAWRIAERRNVADWSHSLRRSRE